MRVYYYLWQFAALFRARCLNRKIHFDLGHHVTFVNDYLWTFLCLMPLPYVWGPIGGNSKSPPQLLLNKAARIRNMLRLSAQAVLRFADPLYWISSLRASAILAINKRSAGLAPLRWLASGELRVEPAIAIEYVDSSVARPERDADIEILFAGHFIPIKAPHIVVEAFAMFAGKYAGHANLTMIGNGPMEKSLRKLVADRQIESMVEFREWMPRRLVLERMSNADIFLFPSMESAGMVVLEAMACGLPVVCLDFGGPATVVTRESGILAPVGSLQETIKGLSDGLMILTDRALRHSMGENARHLANTRYSWSRKGQVTQEVYDSCLKNALKRVRLFE